MADNATRHRQREQLRATELIILVATYRRIKAMGELQPLTKGLTFDGLLDAILDHEDPTGNSTNATH